MKKKLEMRDPNGPKGPSKFSSAGSAVAVERGTTKAERGAAVTEKIVD